MDINPAWWNLLTLMVIGYWIYVWCRACGAEKRAREAEASFLNAVQRARDSGVMCPGCVDHLGKLREGSQAK